MWKTSIFYGVVSFFLCVLVLFSTVTEAQQRLASDTVTVQTRNGSHSFTAEMAVSRAEKAQGMMYRTTIGDDEAMLFVYPEPQRMSYWMANVVIPLDILFIRADGRILNIIRNAKPGSEAPLPSRGMALGVLEIRGGRAKELGIRPGDTVTHALYGTAKN